MEYNFRHYHYRSINAANEEERAAINQELKDLYASLPEEEKANFNRQLQTFLAQEVGRLKSGYESVRGNLSDN